MRSKTPKAIKAWHRLRLFIAFGARSKNAFGERSKKQSKAGRPGVARYEAKKARGRSPIKQQVAFIAYAKKL
jgi:hypothetical protein